MHFASLPQDDGTLKGSMETFKRMYNEIDEVDEVCFCVYVLNGSARNTYYVLYAQPLTHTHSYLPVGYSVYMIINQSV
jgi:hypothetical protein